jgi:hypothetical protein
LVPDLVELIKTWRAQVPLGEGQDLFETYLTHQGGRVTPFIKIEDRTFMIPLGAYYFFPEWPGTAYLKIATKVRFQRLKKLWEHENDWLEPHEEGRSGRKKPKKRAVATELRELDPHPAEYGLDPVSEAGVLPQASLTKWSDGAYNRFTESLRKNIRLSYAMRVFRSDAEELAILRISWSRSDKYILDLFSKWLAANRPTAFRRQGATGRSHPLAKKRTELEYLRRYLIAQDAGTWEINVGWMPLFRDRFKYNACRKAVESILDGLIPVLNTPV